MNRSTNDSSKNPRHLAYVNAGVWTTDTLWTKLVEHCTERPDAVAVVDQDGSRRTTFLEVFQQASKFGEFLAIKGLGPGDVVSIQLPNQLEAVVCALGSLAAGCTVNPLLPSYRERELKFMLGKVRSKCVVTPGTYRGYDYSALISALRAHSGSIEFIHIATEDRAGDISFAKAIDHIHSSKTVKGISPTSPSEIIFSSGTESDPKAIVHTEQTTNFAVRNLAQHLSLTSNDVVWMPSPVGHSTGFNTGMRASIYLGLTLVLQDVWNPEVAVRLINAENATYTLAATTFLQDLLDAATRSNERLPTMRVFGCGGATVPSDIIERGKRSGIDVLRIYGATETLPVSWHRPGSAQSVLATSDGPVMAHMEVEIRDDAGTSCSDGVEGEIFVRGPSCALGYFDDPERSRQTFGEDGWVRTGDLGTLASGYLAITGRKKEIIIRGGMNIAPREVEELLLKIPAVERAAVVGLPHDRLGEVACACVRLRKRTSLSFDDMISYLRAAGVASFKLPEAYVLIDEFPTTASGKIQKNVLRTEILSGRYDLKRRVS